MAAVFGVLIVVVGTVSVPSVAVAAPGAGSPFDCTGGTIYQVQRGSGTTGIINALAVGSMSGTNPVTATQLNATVPDSQPNALGISVGGAAGWAIAPQSPTATGNTLTFQMVSYNPTTSTWTTHTATVDTNGKLPSGVTAASIATGGIVAGAVDPLSGNFYWASFANAPNGSITFFGWNTSTNTSIGVVANSSLPEDMPSSGGTNGDITFDRKGNVYVVSSVGTSTAAGVIPGPLPTTPQTSPPTLTDTRLTTYSNPNSNAYNGIAFDNTGSLFLEYSTSTTTTAILKINPNTGAILAGPSAVNFATTGGTIGVDLGACSNPPVMQLQKNVVNRQADTDEFNLSITGGGLSGGNTATTSGSANGVQAAAAGPVLGVTGTTYTFAETAAGTTTLANYTTTYQCVDQGAGNAIVASGTTKSFNLLLPPPGPTETGQFILCTFTNSAPRLVVSKSVVPASTTPVSEGQTLTYTLTFDNSGGGQPASVNYTDDLTKVIDDATVTTPPALATGSGLTVSGITAGKFTITGTLAARATATVTYRVKVNTPDAGDHRLDNFVVPTGNTPPSSCLPTNTTCTTNPVLFTTSTPTTVFDAATNTAWAGTEKTGASAYDTATVTGAGVTPTGTVTYTFFTNNTCTGTGDFGGHGHLDSGRDGPQLVDQGTTGGGRVCVPSCVCG